MKLNPPVFNRFASPCSDADAEPDCCPIGDAVDGCPNNELAPVLPNAGGADDATPPNPDAPNVATGAGDGVWNAFVVVFPLAPLPKTLPEPEPIPLPPKVEAEPNAAVDPNDGVALAGVVDELLPNANELFCAGAAGVDAGVDDEPNALVEDEDEVVD